MIHSAFRGWAAALLFWAASPGVSTVALQTPSRATIAPPSAPLPAKAMRVPFGVGERFDYEVRLGSLKVGNSQMQVRGVENIRGRDAWHTAFWLKGGTFFYRVNDLFESWIDVETFSSLRFVKQLEEGTADREQSYEIYPERGVYVNQRNDKPTRTLPTVRQPLDDGSFLYFVRTLQLVVGETYDFTRYFIPDRNPVRIKVLRRERVTVPAGTFNAIVVQPIIKTKGIFSEDGHAEVWLSDDSARMVLQLKSRLAFGSLNLFLTSYALATGPAKKTSGM
ncbi:MAG TPA: DUF3108 domain-containing protein [Gemmatimonadaceae bacterium]|nr:DUF3108 domain-containing protein [Gemmatimonadaceae bacterium]